ncbi:MAG: hypothetical protein RLY93_14995 [Sumerlaeia bacterium]
MATERFSTLPKGDDVRWVTLPVTLPAECIQRVCVLMEGYDNLAVVRTPVPGVGLLHVYVWSGHEALARRVLADIGREFPLHIGEAIAGMVGQDETWIDHDKKPNRSAADTP